MTSATEPTSVTEPTTVPADGQAETKPAGKTQQRLAEFRANIKNWPGFVREPMSLKQTWELSRDIDSTRVPNNSNLLHALWWIDKNFTRPLLFLLILLLPSICTGPLLWVALRPSRRAGFYALAGFILVIIPLWAS